MTTTSRLHPHSTHWVTLRADYTDQIDHDSEHDARGWLRANTVDGEERILGVEMRDADGQHMGLRVIDSIDRTDGGPAEFDSILDL